MSEATPIIDLSDLPEDPTELKALLLDERRRG